MPAVVGAALLAYYLGRDYLPNFSTWWDIAFIGLVVIPAVFSLVLLALPLQRAVGLLPVGIAFLVLGFVSQRAGLGLVGNFAKLAAMSALAFWFLSYFETLAWVLLVAAIVPWVDIYSVWRGPTRHIVEHQQHLFTTLSFAFPVPGERSVLVEWQKGTRDVRGYNLYRATRLPVPTSGEPLNDKLLAPDRTTANDGGRDTGRSYYYVVQGVAPDGQKLDSATAAAYSTTSAHPQPVDVRAVPSGAPRAVSAKSGAASANLGLPDLLFFGLFLAAAVRFGLRVRWTWLAMALSFGTTIALAVWWNLAGLPALPLLALGFVLPNADKVWRTIRPSTK
ncbi:MAG: hypothetical protein ACR2MU_05015 [Gaiellaceae bacterium]